MPDPPVPSTAFCPCRPCRPSNEAPPRQARRPHPREGRWGRCRAAPRSDAMVGSLQLVQAIRRCGRAPLCPGLVPPLVVTSAALTAVSAELPPFRRGVRQGFEGRWLARAGTKDPARTLRSSRRRRGEPSHGSMGARERRAVFSEHRTAVARPHRVWRDGIGGVASRGVRRARGGRAEDTNGRTGFHQGCRPRIGCGRSRLPVLRAGAPTRLGSVRLLDVSSRQALPGGVTRHPGSGRAGDGAADAGGA